MINWPAGIAAIVSMAFPLSTPGDDAPPPAPVIDEIALDRDRAQRMTVPVTIQGQGPFRFMIDTGSQRTVVTRELGERLALRPAGTATLVGIASFAAVDLVELDGIEFAQRRFDGLTAPVLERRNLGVDGIIGLDSLQDLRVLLDFRADTLSIADATAPGGDEGYEIVVRAYNRFGRLILADAELDGVRTAVIVDTGAQGSMGNLALQRRLRAREQEVVSTTDVHGKSIEGPLDYVHTLRVGRLALQSVPVTFADASVFGTLELGDQPALILGMDSLRAFERVAIDFSQRRVLFDVPPGYMSQGKLRKKYFPSRL